MDSLEKSLGNHLRNHLKKSEGLNQPGNCSRELRILLRSIFLTMPYENNKEIVPESSRSSGLPFPYIALLETIRKSLPKAPDPPGPFPLPY